VGIRKNLSAAAAEDSEKRPVVILCLVAGIRTVPVDCEDSVVSQVSMNSKESELKEFDESELEESVEFDQFDRTRFKKFDIVSRFIVDMMNIILIPVKDGRRYWADEQ
jgi:hypothetical protein